MSKILLIDPHNLNCQVLAQRLKLYSYDVVTAQRGDDGGLLAISESPDLILVDIDISVVNGWQLIKIWKNSSSTWLIPVVAIADRAIDGQLLTQAGFDTYIRKPVNLRHLLLKINVLIDTFSANQVEKDNVLSPRSASSAIAVAEEATAPPRPPDNNATIVYVEDSLADSMAMADVVERAGYSYANISDSVQALPQLLELKPELIFLDLVMPMANGYELCAQIRRISAFQTIPIIIVTNNDGIADRVRSRIVGASGFLSKPIKEVRVLRVLMKYLYPFRV